MNYFTADGIGRIFILRLDQGDFVLEKINELIKKEDIKNGVVLSGIGTLDNCTLHMVTSIGYPPVEHFETWDKKPLELSSIEGFIANGKPHLHCVVSDHEKAYSGHLEEGCRVLYLCEIVVAEVNSVNLERRPNSFGITQLEEKSDK